MSAALKPLEYQKQSCLKPLEYQTHCSLKPLEYQDEYRVLEQNLLFHIKAVHTWYQACAKSMRGAVAWARGRETARHSSRLPRSTHLTFLRAFDECSTRAQHSSGPVPYIQCTPGVVTDRTEKSRIGYVKGKRPDRHILISRCATTVKGKLWCKVQFMN